MIGVDRTSVRYQGVRPDDVALRERLKALAQERRRFGYRRLERAYVEKWGQLSPDARREIARRSFSDFHLLRADNEYSGLNELIVDAAVEVA